MERDTRFELAPKPWKGHMLPLHQSRILYGASGWIRTNNVYPEGLVLQTSATPPSSLPTHLYKESNWIFGAHKKIRTSYLQIRSLSLYPNELYGLIMVDLTRLELVTFRLSGERSDQLSYRSMVEITRIELVSRRFHFGF